jgi:putative endonuclease
MFAQATFFVYVLRSLADGDRYVGLSTDVPRRVEEHNIGRVKSTKARVPFVLLYQESFDTRMEGRTREKYFKTAAGRRWLDKRGF